MRLLPTSGHWRPPLLALALVAVALFAWGQHTPRASAHAGNHGDSMFFDLEAGSGPGNTCNSSQAPPYNECDAFTGEPIGLTFYFQPHTIAWTYVQFSIEYEGVTSKDNPFFDGVVPCDGTNLDAQPGSVIMGCTVTTPSGGVMIAHLQLNCTDTPSTANEVRFYVGVGDNDSYFQEQYGTRHSQATQTRSMFINCIDPEYADMHLEMKGGDASCDSMPDPTSCTVPPNGTFQVAIATNDPPDDGIGSLNTNLLFPGLLYLPAPDNPGTYPFPNEGAEAETLWPNSQDHGREPFFGLNGTEGYVDHYANRGTPNYTGNLIQVELQCQQPGTYPVTLTALRYPNDGSHFYRVDTGGGNAPGTVYIGSPDTLTIVCQAPPTPTPTPRPPSLGGVADYPDVGSGGNAWPLATAAAGLAALVLAGGAWRARRRLRAEPDGGRHRFSARTQRGGLASHPVLNKRRQTRILTRDWWFADAVCRRA
jgi:hypothetical protein